MDERELKNKVNELYWKGLSYDEIAKNLKISWAEVINYLEVDYYD